jgi:hypothetical protein|tara:strand:+ start:2092 stop:2214 length:123 start_codon:yes stop_codon:yes gene_type:complete
MGAAKGTMEKTERAAAIPKYGAIVNKNRSPLTWKYSKIEI